MFEYAVVGSGIGGSTMAALLNAKGKSVALFEKEPYLGGCSSTFMHKNRLYNSGATTFAGYEEGFVVKEIFDEIGFTPDILPTDPSIVVIQNTKITPRYSDFDKFYEVVSKNYKHEKNLEFWRLVYEINSEFYNYKTHYYSNSNIISKTISLLSFIPLFLKFYKYLKVNAKSFIEDFFDGIDEEYMQFLESQILIVAQAKTYKINFFTAALALGYTFNKNYYAVGGFSKLFDGLTQNLEHIYKNTEILSIKRLPTHFELVAKNKSYSAKKIILNSTIYDSASLFSDKEIRAYYKKYEKLNNHQSSFMLYMTIKSKKKFEHHYQIIKDDMFVHTISKAVFVSFWEINHDELSHEWEYSITISIHTDERFWEDKTKYKKRKNELLNQLLETILETLDITMLEVKEHFGATPRTFRRYINRSQLGGNAITMKNFLPFLPSNDTPIEGLFHVGDSVYTAQGWPGVMFGVKNLKRLLDV